MKRAQICSLAVLMVALAVLGGCAELASSRSQPRGAQPGMAEGGTGGLSRESKSYIANDPP
jgi:hypothetical protein